MLSTKKLPAAVLPEINFEMPPEDFKKAAFQALKNSSGFVLTNLGQPFCVASQNLFAAFDDFLEQDEEEKSKFLGPEDYSQLRGFFPYGTFFSGSKACHRFFIGNKENKIDQPLPSPSQVKVSMHDATLDLLTSTSRILARCVEATEEGLGIPDHQLANMFTDYEMLTIVDNYLPITQEKLLAWASQDRLTKTEEDGRFETFLSHKDLMPFSMLIYRNNNAQGLEVKLPDEQGMRSFQPVCLQTTDPYDLKAVIFAGKVLEILTDDKLQALEHRVVMDPMQAGEVSQRNLISNFPLLNSSIESNKVFQPIIVSKEGPHYRPEPSATFFARHADRYIKDGKERAVSKPAVDELVVYPTEAEIETIHHPTAGTTYKRSGF